mmetsp:Transcript_14641/g.58510  ORF Transcript_14641/g.58510 Transcript_14641/m.58510 type:complete len:303 (+) Transcript_14641:4118-5026(+)
MLLGRHVGIVGVLDDGLQAAAWVTPRHRATRTPRASERVAALPRRGAAAAEERRPRRQRPRRRLAPLRDAPRLLDDRHLVRVDARAHLGLVQLDRLRDLREPRAPQRHPLPRAPVLVRRVLGGAPRDDEAAPRAQVDPRVVPDAHFDRTAQVRRALGAPALFSLQHDADDLRTRSVDCFGGGARRVVLGVVLRPAGAASRLGVVVVGSRLFVATAGRVALFVVGVVALVRRASAAFRAASPHGVLLGAAPRRRILRRGLGAADRAAVVFLGIVLADDGGPLLLLLESREAVPRRRRRLRGHR